MQRKLRQDQVGKWVEETFGAAHAHNVDQRALRFLEEAIELFQALGGNREYLNRVADVVYSKPLGDISMEIGQVGLSLLSIGHTVDIDVDQCERNEVARVETIPAAEMYKRNKAKNDLGLDAGAYPTGD